MIPVKADNLKIESKTALLYNLNDNQILFQKNKSKKVSIASLTKIMTSIIVIENTDNLNKKVTFQKSDYDKLVEMDASGSSLDKNKSYTYEDLLYGLILESGADCALALARLTETNNKDFVTMMNEKAQALGMKNTSFANPIGMDDKNNYSTMEDMSILLKYGLKNPTFKKIITTFHYKLSDNTVIDHTIYNYMKKFEVKMPYLKGGKTGYETDAGFALASIAKQNNTTLMLITSKAEYVPGHIEDAKKIYDYYYNNYSYQPIINKGDTIITLNTEYLSKEQINIKAEKDISYYLKNNYNPQNIRTIYDGIKTITPNNKYQENIGTLKIYYQNKLIKKIPVTLNQKIYPSYKLIILAVLIYIFIIGSAIIVAYRIRHKKTIGS